MKKNTITWLLALSPFLSFSQGVKANLYDKFLKKHRLETEAVAFSGLPADTRLSLAFTAVDTTLFLNVSGSGWGTRTVDKGDVLELLFSNDSIVTLKSISLQGFEPGMLQNSYQHQYLVAAKQLTALTNYSLVGIRKYSFSTSTDLKIPELNATKFTKLSALFVRELKKVNILRPLVQISTRDIRNHIGDSVEFCSKVYRTRYFEGSADGPTLLDVQADFSDPFVNVVILEKDRSAFNGTPEKKYLNRDVCISGVLALRNNIPYLVLHRREQIKVKGTVDLAEIDLFVGDSVTVAGKVFTVRSLPDSKTAPALLNVGAPYPNQSLTLVIQNNDRVNFAKPEDYIRKTLQVSGKVEKYNGQTQIVLHQSKQVKVLADAEPVTPVASVQIDSTVTTSVQKKKDTIIKTESAPVVNKALAQTAAVFPGGDSAFALFIRKNIAIPESVSTSDEKKVIISFDVDTKGIWHNMRLVTSAGKELDKELVRVLKRMPKWKPATKDGTAVSSQVVYPVVLIEGKKRKQAF